MFSGEVHPFTQYIVFRDYKVTKSRKKNKVKYPRSILIGHLPPPLTGQSAAFSTAIKFFQEKSLPFVVVDIAGKVSQRPIGQFAWGRVWEISQSLLIFIKHVWRTNQVVYLSIALSPVGFFRDLLFIWIASLFHHRIVLHLHGGGYSYFIQSQRKIFQNLITNTIGQAHKIVVLTEQMKEQFQYQRLL